MQKTLLLLFFFYSCAMCSQRTYHFDQIHEYEITFHSIPVPEHLKYASSKSNTAKIFYYLNSKSRDVCAAITETDSTRYRMVFSDYKGLYFDVFFAKKDLNIAEYIDLKCKFAKRFAAPDRTDYYEYSKMADTTINGRNYARYKLASLYKPRIIKRKKIGSRIYIVDESKTSELPFLNHSTAYMEWKEKSFFPNGLIVEIHFIDSKGNLQAIEKLVNKGTIDKKVVVPDECDYVKYPVPKKIHLYVNPPHLQH